MQSVNFCQSHRHVHVGDNWSPTTNEDRAAAELALAPTIFPNQSSPRSATNQQREDTATHNNKNTRAGIYNDDLEF